MYWSVGPDTKNAEAAKKFIDWFINDPEAADILGTSRGVPVSKKIVGGLESKFTPIDKAAIELINKTAPNAQAFYPGPGLKTIGINSKRNTATLSNKSCLIK